jgi:hypothetical protein
MCLCLACGFSGLEPAARFDGLQRQQSGGFGRAAAKQSLVRILAALDGERGDLHAGIALGEEEARQTLALLGRALEIEWVSATQLPALRQTVISARITGYSAAIVALADRTVAWDAAGLPVLVLTNPPDPTAPSGANATPPPEPPARAAATGEPDDPIAPGSWAFRIRAEGGRREWDPALERFGAGELNERFRRRAGRPMTADAWCGWVAVKAIAEAALRARSLAPADVADALRALRFDGHKGQPLYFDARQQLVQPTYE